MASGKVHFISNSLIGIGTIVATAVSIKEFVPAAVIGFVAGTIITPDMDLEGTTFTERMLRSIPIFGLLWQISWYPYALLFRHRGYSHNIFIGTLSRVLWLMFIALFWFILAVGINDVFNLNVNLYIPSIQEINVNLVLVCFISWLLQDINHYVLDGLFKG